MGEKTEKILIQAGFVTPEDFLFHLPRSYQDRTKIVPIRNLFNYSADFNSGVTHAAMPIPMSMPMAVQVEGVILNARVILGRRRMLICEISDEAAVLTLRFFHFHPAQLKAMQKNKKLRAFGVPKLTRTGLEMIHPEYKIFDSEDLYNSPNLSNSSDLNFVPVYTLPAGIHMNKYRSWIREILNEYKNTDENYKSCEFITECVPKEILKKWDLEDLSLLSALEFIHFPTPDTEIKTLTARNHRAFERLAFEELLAHSLFLLEIKNKKQKEKAPVCVLSKKDQAEFLKHISFLPTAAQARVLKEILEDLAKPSPMLRLLQGDVGSGKTWVAALAACAVVRSGYQVAIMAPTEILASQHLKTFSHWFTSAGFGEVGYLSGDLSEKAKREIKQKISEGLIQCIVGTQALFQTDVNFFNLGLIIVDEQHRFGVLQRKALLDKGAQSKPHQLIMTATPIPRTLAMTVYADLDVSILDELPPGRTPIQTALVELKRKAEVILKLKKYLAEGHQAYWVCTLIEEDKSQEEEDINININININKAERAAAEVLYEQLKIALPEFKLGLVHGRMKPNDKQAVMTEFRKGEIKLLIATTVIEVGVDVPNASVMIIENAEYLGLSQLHQLRGRVGRGAKASFCILLYQAPLSDMGRARLEAMRSTSDGFVLAEKDLELRGPGEFIGTRQAGDMNFQFVDFVRDKKKLNKVHEAAKIMTQSYGPEIKMLINRWLRNQEGLTEV